MYCVADARPVSEYVVDVVAVLDTIVENVPPEVDRSILYPDIVPLGKLQERLICDVEIAVAVSPVGEPGSVEVGVGEGVGEPVSRYATSSRK